MKWVQLAKCMRSAGLPIKVMIEYLNLFQQGDETIPARLCLLKEQMEALEEQKRAIQETMDRLAYKIDRYEEALTTGKLVWNKERGEIGLPDISSYDEIFLGYPKLKYTI